MQFDTAKLPKDLQLSLCEMVTFLAWGNSVTTEALGRLGPPSYWNHHREWDAQLNVCQRQASANLDLTDLVQMLDDWRNLSPMPTVDALRAICRAKVLSAMITSGQLNDDHVEPTAEQIEEVRRSWPPACRRLHEMAVAREESSVPELRRLRAAGRYWRRAASKGNFIVTGKQRGLPGAEREVVDHADFEIYRLDWRTNSLDPPLHHRLGRPNSKPAYDDVCCERASFEGWIQCMALDQRGADAPKDKVPAREKKTRGRPPKYTPECEAAARRIAAEKKNCRHPADKTDMAIIRDFQAWWRDEYKAEPPADETVRSWLTKWGL